MKKLYGFLAVFLSMLASPAEASLIEVLSNGDLESGIAGPPATFIDWTNGNGIATEHSGLGVGSTRAAYLVAQNPNTAIGGDTLSQSLNNAPTDFTLDYLFASEIGTGNAMQMIIRVTNSPGSTTSNLNLTILSNGALGMREDSGFVNAFGPGVIAASVDGNGDNDFDGGAGEGDILNVHRIRIVGRDFGTANYEYDISLSAPNVLDGTFAHQSLANKIFQGIDPSTPGSGDLVELRFQTGFSRSDYAIDNLSFVVPVPEPTTTGILGLSLASLLFRRRRRAVS